MSTSLQTFGSDRRLCLAASECVRSPVYAGNWNRIRIALQFNFINPTADITGTPRFAFGVCHGNANVMVAPTSDHLWGLRFNNPTLTYTPNGGVPALFSTNPCNIESYLRVGGTETRSSPSANPALAVGCDAPRNVLFLEITKNTGSEKIEWLIPTTFSDARTDVSDAQFQAAMEVANLGDIVAAVGLTDYSQNNPASYPTIDEATNGALDNIFVYWERSVPQFSFNIRHRKMA